MSPATTDARRPRAEAVKILRLTRHDERAITSVDAVGPLGGTGSTDVIGPGHVCLIATPNGDQTLLVHHGRIRGLCGRAVFMDAFDVAW
jgi:hypothetical protein